MVIGSELIPQYVELWTYSDVLSNLVDILDVIVVNYYFWADELVRSNYARKNID